MPRKTPQPPRPADLDAAMGPRQRINFLVTPAEKAEIEETAQFFGLTVTDYMLRLHRLTRALLESRRKRARAKEPN